MLIAMFSPGPLILIAQLAALGAVSAQSQAGPSFALPAGFRALYQQPAWQARVVGDTIVIVEEGFTHLRGIDRNGKTRWRTQYQPAPRGMQELFAPAGVALMYAGERLVGVNPQSGAIQADTKVPFLTGSFGRDADTGCWLNHSNGACSVSCACSFQLVSCKDGSSIGPHYDFNRICREERGLHSNSRSSSCGCWGHDGTLVGRSGDVLVASLNGLRATATAAPVRPRIAVGVDARSGAEVWQHEVATEPASYVNGAGVSASGRTCWLGDAMGALTAIDCQSGKLLWHVQSQNASPPHMPESWVAAVAAPPGIFHFSREGATLYDERSGTPLWTRSTTGLAFAVPRGALPKGASVSRDAGEFLVLDPSTGQTTAKFTLESKGATVFDAGRGQYLIQRGRAVRLHDRYGGLLAQATLPCDGTIELGDQLLVVTSTEMLAVLDLRTLALRGSFAGWFAAVAVEKELGARRLLIERYGDRYYTGEQKIRQLALIEVAPGKEPLPIAGAD